ncbi:ANTAR domain-containing protein [Streptomyces chrestomyceticus]|uniref:ANTAR domain-containing protein n=1 Tax=Streptomyces chrestomyceticus TaxID=68185 RepID=UPI00367DF664
MPEPAPRVPAAAAQDAPTPPAAAATPVLAAIEVSADGEHTDVTVRGELDMNTGPQIEPGLYAALGASAHGLDLYLGAVRFCDCAGLGTLLRLRSRALAQHKTVTVRATSSAVERTLELTGTAELFHGPAPSQDTGTGLRTDLHVEVAQLRRALQTRPAIDVARGLLMAAFDLSPEAAWKVLVATSQNTNTKLHRLAQDLIDSHQGTALPDTTQQHLKAAVTSISTSEPAEPATSLERRAEPGQRTAPPDG